MSTSNDEQIKLLIEQVADLKRTCEALIETKVAELSSKLEERIGGEINANGKLQVIESRMNIMESTVTDLAAFAKINCRFSTVCNIDLDHVGDSPIANSTPDSVDTLANNMSFTSLRCDRMERQLTKLHNEVAKFRRTLAEHQVWEQVTLRQYDGFPCVRVFDHEKPGAKIVAEIANNTKMHVLQSRGEFLQVRSLDENVEGWVGWKNVVTSPEVAQCHSPPRLGTASQSSTQVDEYAGMNAVQLESTETSGELVNARFTAFMCATEMRCDRLERRLDELRQGASHIGFQERGGECSNQGTREPLEGNSENETRIAVSQHSAPKKHFRRSLTMDKEMTDDYEFQESVWDLALFIGMPQLGSLGSVYSAFLLLTNATLQIATIVIINEVFTEPEIGGTTINAMRKWRVFFGHSFTLADKLTFESLASRVCKHDPSVPYGDGVLKILQEISDYWPDRSDYDEKVLPLGHFLPFTDTPIGVALCIISIVIWLLEIISHFDRQWSLAVALKDLPTCNDANVDRSDSLKFEQEDTITWTMMSPHRKAWCTVIIISQYVVLVPLATMGVLWLVNTISMRDLLLNSSALAIVLMTDDLFFAALAPRSGKILMRAMAPLPRRTSRTYKGLNWEVVFGTGGLACALAISSVPLSNLVDNLRDAKNEVCDGNLKFIAVRDNAGIISAGDADIDVISNVESTYFFQAMRQLVTHPTYSSKFFAADGSMAGTVSGMTSSIWSLQTTRDRDVDAVMGYWNSECIDMLPKSAHRYSPYLLQILQDAAGDLSINDCNDVRTRCSGDNLAGTRTRQFCPVKCGCNDGSAGLILEGIIGCPPACTRSSAYNASMWSKDCVDEAITSPYWDRYIAGLRSMEASYPSNWVGGFNKSIKKLRDNGCRVISDKLPLEFVSSNWSDPCITSPAKVKSLIYACPLTCGCHTQYRIGCPLKCEALSGGR